MILVQRLKISAFNNLFSSAAVKRLICFLFRYYIEEKIMYMAKNVKKKYKKLYRILYKYRGIIQYFTSKVISYI